jgi:hypothetical protein
MKAQAFGFDQTFQAYRKDEFVMVGTAGRAPVAFAAGGPGRRSPGVGSNEASARRSLRERHAAATARLLPPSASGRRGLPSPGGTREGS